MIRQLLVITTGLCLMLTMEGQQQSLSGRVLDTGRGEPVPYATVYVNGSTRGTTSGEDGSFELKEISLPLELVCSHISYGIQILAVNDTALTTGLEFRLRERPIPLMEATIMDENQRDDYLKRFKSLFLGEPHKELDAEILNDSVLFFFPGKDREFEAVAGAPLDIVVRRSGYSIRCDLGHFRVTKMEDAEQDGPRYHCSILGHYLFKEISAKTRRQQRQLARERNWLFYNSRLHFCRSFYRNGLYENGYQVKAMCPGFMELDNPDHLYRAFKSDYSEDASGQEVLLLSNFKCKEFNIDYYQNSRSQPLDLNHFIALPKYLMESGMFVYGDTVRIYPTGRVPDNSLLFNGKIGNKGVAFLLPEDYIPSMQ